MLNERIRTSYADMHIHKAVKASQREQHTTEFHQHRIQCRSAAVLQSLRSYVEQGGQIALAASAPGS